VDIKVSTRAGSGTEGDLKRRTTRRIMVKTVKSAVKESIDVM
jgi:hypothetical protein